MPGHFVPKLIPRQSLFATHRDIVVGGIDEQLAVLSTVSQIKASESSSTDLPARATIARVNLPLLKRLMLNRIRHRTTMATAMIELLALLDFGLERGIGLRPGRLIRRLQRRAIEFLDIELVEVHALEAAHLWTREHTDPASTAGGRTLTANSFPSIMPGARASTAVPHVGQNLSGHQLSLPQAPRHEPCACISPCQTNTPSAHSHRHARR